MCCIIVIDTHVTVVLGNDTNVRDAKQCTAAESARSMIGRCSTTASDARRVDTTLRTYKILRHGERVKSSGAATLTQCYLSKLDLLYNARWLSMPYLPSRLQ